MSKDNKYCFTDGVGTISRELMVKVHKTITKENPKDTDLFAAIQIRFLGAKGMLTMDDTLSGEVLIIRDSMKKFEDNTKGNAVHTLYILGCSQPKNAYADRQILILLMNIGLSYSILKGY